MCVPGEIIDLWTRFHIWNGGKPLQMIGYMEAYMLVKLQDEAGTAVQHHTLEQLEIKFQHCSHLILPLFAGDHWTLLQANQTAGTVAFADSLNGFSSEATLLKARAALEFWKLLPSWSWVSTVVPPRWNTVRQGKLECGFFVATWLERVILKAAGKQSLAITAAVDVKKVRSRLLRFLEIWRPTMEKLQCEVPGKAAVLEVGEPTPAAATQAALEQDLSKAAGGFKVGLEPTGDAAKVYLLEDYECKEDWASAVLDHLSEAHQKLCTEVLLQSMDGVECKKCTGGCRLCEFWRAVRYWRNIEIGGKMLEGYDKRSWSCARLKGAVGSQVDLQD